MVFRGFTLDYPVRCTLRRVGSLLKFLSSYCCFSRGITNEVTHTITRNETETGSRSVSSTRFVVSDAWNAKRRLKVCAKCSSVVS
jgi:hypothetical protein